MASDVIAWVTLGAVIATGAATTFLAWKTSNMAASTERLAKATSDSVALQREELEAVMSQELIGQQVAQARYELLTARQRALARLEIDGSFDDRGQLSGHVTYVSGTDPAYKVMVWTRHNRGSQRLPCGTLTPVRNHFPFVFPSVVDDVSDQWPFRDADHLGPHQLRWFYLRMTWRDIDDSLQRLLVKKSGDEPPEVVLDDVAVDLDSIELNL